MRKVNHAKENNGSVAKNKNFQWSLYHSLAIYNLDSIYTFIPKNACSTMRFSIAVQNGFLKHFAFDLNRKGIPKARFV